MKVSSSGYKVLYKGQGNFTLKMVRQALARMSKRENRKFLMVGTLAGKITTIKNDDCTRCCSNPGHLPIFLI